MPVALLRTEGRGREAEVEVDGHLLAVVDRVSAADEPAPPGTVDGARLEVVAIPRLCGPAAGEEPVHKGLVRERGWRYHARAEGVSVEPLRETWVPSRWSSSSRSMGLWLRAST